MLEILIAPAIIGGLALLPKRSNDKRKIELIFNRLGIAVPNKNGDPIYPKYKGKQPIMIGEKQVGITYRFGMPVGLPSTKVAKIEKDGHVFRDGLHKPVETEYRDGYFLVHVYDKQLASLVPYAELPHEYEKWKVPLGLTQRGYIWRDFDAIPHMTIAGTTRFGKTVALKTTMTYLLEHHPDDIDIYIIDLKGGLEFGKYEHLQQVKGFASDLEETFDLLFSLVNRQPYREEGKGKNKQRIEMELGRMIMDYKVFRHNGWSNVVDTPIKKRTFVIVDEAAQLAPDKWMSDQEKMLMGACQSYLSEIARLGGALGYRLVFCTQYPTSDTLPRQIKMNSDVKMTFRLSTGYASEVAIDDRGAEELSTELKGRALYKTHEVKEMQVPLIKDKEMEERLQRYQMPKLYKGEKDNVINVEEAATPGTNFVEPVSNEICDPFTITGGTRLEK